MMTMGCASCRDTGVREAVDPDKHYTYADYFGWDDGKRYELIDGTAYLMEPAPMWEHQGIQMQIASRVHRFLDGMPGIVFTAPFDVRLNADAGDDTVLQPDIVVFSDRSKLSGTGCIGAPDMVIEILSPSTANRDKVDKFNQYLQAGVQEYWIVDPKGKTVQACILNQGEYDVVIYGEGDEVPVHILEGCVIRLAEVFAE